MTTNFAIQHKTYLKVLVLIICIYVIAVSLGFYFAEHKQYWLFSIIILIIIGNVYLGKKYSKKLNQVLIISDAGLKICLPDIINIFEIRIIEDEFAWDEITDVKLFDNNNGPVIIQTCRGEFRFWHPLENRTNLKIVELIKIKIQKNN